jgi:hypothetical protein
MGLKWTGRRRNENRAAAQKKMIHAAALPAMMAMGATSKR